MKKSILCYVWNWKKDRKKNLVVDKKMIAFFSTGSEYPYGEEKADDGYRAFWKYAEPVA